MYLFNPRALLPLCFAALLFTGACSRREDVTEELSDAGAQATAPLRTEAWVDDVQVSGPAGADAGATQKLTPGEKLQISMSVEDAPRGTVITAYWYGPDNRQLAYESQTVEPEQRQMSFSQENTHEWAVGTYRAEVWVGDNKVEEQTFDIVSG